MLLLAESVPDVELDTLKSICTWVFARLAEYISVCNEHHVFWVPVGFAIAGVTVGLFRYAMGINNHNSNY